MPEAMPDLTVIAAIGRRLELATAEGIPWNLPDDVAHFRSYCAGKWMVVGRITYEEMRGWFSDQTVLVLTGKAAIEGRCIAVADIASALQAGAAGRAGELVVAGGAACYRAALPYATRLVLTRVHGTFPEATVFFPQWESSEWDLESRKPHPADSRHGFGFDIENWRRWK